MDLGFWLFLFVAVGAGCGIGMLVGSRIAFNATGGQMNIIPGGNYCSDDPAREIERLRAASNEKPDDRIHKAPPSDERADFRSATPMGFARAVFAANHAQAAREVA